MQTVKANWPAIESDPQQVVAFTTTRQLKVPDLAQQSYAGFNLGLHVGDAADAVRTNRQQLMQYCQLKNAQWLEQVHGVKCVQAQRSAQVPIADACWTNEIDLACVVMTADCLPVAMRQGDKVAVAHAGWRGLLAGVLESSLAVLNPTETDIWMGPAIGPAVFEVGSEVRELFLAENADNTSAFKPAREKAKWLANIYLLGRIRLIKAGVKAERIYGGGACTFTEHERFYSYRRQAITGRMATVIYRTNRG